MGNLSTSDRRFDKPAVDALVDLLNHSNKSFIRYGEIEADLVMALEQAETLPVNTKVRIRLKDAPVNAPSTIVAYQRLSLEEFIPSPTMFVFVDSMPTQSLFDQLRTHYGVWLTPQDTQLTVGPANEEGVRVVGFQPRADHFVWHSGVEILAGPEEHLQRLIPENRLDGFTREALTA